MEEEEENTINGFLKYNKYLFTSIGTKRFREYYEEEYYAGQTWRICSDKQRKRDFSFHGRYRMTELFMSRIPDLPIILLLP